MPDRVRKNTAAWKILAAVALVVIGAVVAIPFLLDANQFRPRLESEMSDAVGRQVKIGRLKLSLLTGGIAADDVAIADDSAFASSPFVRAKSLQIGVELKPLIFSKTLRITGIRLERPEITLIRSNAGVWNFSGIGSKPGAGVDKDPMDKRSTTPASDVSVGSLQVTDGRVSVFRGGKHAKARVYDSVNIKARDLSFQSVFPFSLTAVLPGGGTLKVDGKAGPLNRQDASLTPLSASLAISRLDLIASGFIEPDSGLKGLIDFDGSVDSDGRHMRSKGTVKADKLQIVHGGSPAARPVLLNYVLDHDLKGQKGTLRETKVQFGKAVARLDGTYDMSGENTNLAARMRGEGMPAEDLEFLLPAIAVALPKGASLQGGSLNADLKTEGPIDRLVTSGAMSIVGTRLSGFDLGSKMTTVTTLAGIKPSSFTEIEKLASNVRVAPNGIQVDGLTLVVPALGMLTGDGTIGSNSSMDFKMLARLDSSAGLLGGLSTIAGVKTGSEVAVPFFIRGTTSNPSFVPDAKWAARSLLNSALAGKGANQAEGNPTQKLGDTLRGLFEKKKKP
jgi:AsmA protein